MASGRNFPFGGDRVRDTDGPFDSPWRRSWLIVVGLALVAAILFMVLFGRLR